MLRHGEPKPFLGKSLVKLPLGAPMERQQLGSASPLLLGTGSGWPAVRNA